jgi:hypothetical protein
VSGSRTMIAGSLSKCAASEGGGVTYLRLETSEDPSNVEAKSINIPCLCPSDNNCNQPRRLARRGAADKCLPSLPRYKPGASLSPKNRNITSSPLGELRPNDLASPRTRRRHRPLARGSWPSPGCVKSAGGVMPRQQGSFWTHRAPNRPESAL